MSIADFAEKIYVELDKLNLHSSSIRVDISEIIDYAFRIQSEKDDIEKKLQTEIQKLLIQLQQKQKYLLNQSKQVIFDFEKIELLLYEKNEYKMLHDCIDFVKACKMNLQKRNLLNWDSEQISDDAFLCSNSLNMQKTILFAQENKKLQEIIQNINKSSISLSQKEQLVYNIIKSQTKTLSPKQHVILDDVLNISYQPNNKKTNLSILSSIQFPDQINTNNTKLNILGDKILLLTNEGFKDCASPKFQFSSLSPIKPIQVNKDKSLKSHRSSLILGSFQNSEIKSQQKLIIPRIKIEKLEELKEKDDTDYKEMNKKYGSFNSQDNINNKSNHMDTNKKKNRKQLCLFEKQSFYDKSTFLNIVSNVTRSKETKDTDNRRSDSQKSRERNQTFHCGQPQQSKFLKELMQRVYSRNNPIKKPYKISEFEKKQLSLLIGNIKKQKSLHN
ncbi:unnamed protein product [Paramecium sonneborni]|uniref:Uncharacterized protein n=1 Tax=Paramecium sonneborni TaxID=65129 RepID=A0A8S1LLW0_9CILI|nr:unnamed protein product [Paramecium sonneborni]